MKKIIILFAILVLFITSFGETIQVVTEEYPPFNYSEYGVVKGLSTDIVKAVFKEAGIDYNIEVYPWARAYNTTLQTKNQLIYTIGLTKERKNLFKWIGPIVTADEVIIKLKSRKDIVINSIEDLKKYRSGCVRDDLTDQYLQTFGIKSDNTVIPLQSIKKLVSGRIDTFTYEYNVFNYLIKKNGLNPNDFEMAYKLKDISKGGYMAFNADTPDSLVKKLQEALVKIKENGTYDKILKKWNN